MNSRTLGLFRAAAARRIALASRAAGSWATDGVTTARVPPTAHKETAVTEPADLEALIAQLEEQQEQLQFSRFTNDDAWDLGSLLVSLAQARGLVLTVDIRRHGHQLFHAALPGTTPDNDTWIERKIRVVNRFGDSSFLVGRRLALTGKPGRGVRRRTDPVRGARRVLPDHRARRRRRRHGHGVRPAAGGGSRPGRGGRCARFLGVPPDPLTVADHQARSRRISDRHAGRCLLFALTLRGPFVAISTVTGELGTELGMSAPRSAC